MAISLNNHETRIKALESGGVSSVRFTKIYQTNAISSGSKSINIPNLSTYDAIYVRMSTQSSWNAGDVAIIPKAEFGFKIFTEHVYNAMDSYYTISNDKIVMGGNNCTILAVFGINW